MRKAKVISLAVAGRSNEIFRPGDIVTENNFEINGFDAHIKEGHIAEVIEEKPEAIAIEEEVKEVEIPEPEGEQEEKPEAKNKKRK